jgi:hypothetical protein
VYRLSEATYRIGVIQRCGRLTSQELVRVSKVASAKLRIAERFLLRCFALRRQSNRTSVIDCSLSRIANQSLLRSTTGLGTVIPVGFACRASLVNWAFLKRREGRRTTSSTSEVSFLAIQMLDPDRDEREEHGKADVQMCIHYCNTNRLL